LQIFIKILLSTSDFICNVINNVPFFLLIKNVPFCHLIKNVFRLKYTYRNLPKTHPPTRTDTLTYLPTGRSTDLLTNLLTWSIHNRLRPTVTTNPGTNLSRERHHNLWIRCEILLSTRLPFIVSDDTSLQWHLDMERLCASLCRM